MKLCRAMAVMVVGLAGSGCLETLATPADCPDLCPGTSLTVRDTTIEVRLHQDSTFVGYLSADQVGAVLVSNGISAGEARGYAVFAKRPDSVMVDGLPQAYTIDSIGVTLNLVARDTAVRDLRILLHRIPATVDTTTPFAELDGSLTPESLIDSISVHDSLRAGQLRLIVKGDALARIAPFEADSGLLGLGLRVTGAAPTGVRLGSVTGSAGPPVLFTWVHAAVTDTAKQRQTFTIGASQTNYVLGGLPDPGPDQLFLGGRSGSRMLLRFSLPKALRDSAAVIRATLELTLAGPIKGLNNDPAELQVRGVLADIGAKSPPLGNIAAASRIVAGATGVQSIDIRAVVSAWFGPSGTIPTILLGLAPEGGTFFRPEFFSSQAATGAPRLRLTYALPSRPGHP